MLPSWLRKKEPRASAPLRARFFHPSVLTLEDRLLLTLFSVTTTADSGAGSLRQAILDANGNPGGDSIIFSILVGGGGVQTIRPASPLPIISGPVFIDGTSQP